MVSLPFVLSPKFLIGLKALYNQSPGYFSIQFVLLLSQHLYFLFNSRPFFAHVFLWWEDHPYIPPPLFPHAIAWPTSYSLFISLFTYDFFLWDFSPRPATDWFIYLSSRVPTVFQFSYQCSYYSILLLAAIAILMY